MPGRGKPIPDKTKLGRLLRKHDMKVYEVCAKAGIYNRLMTEYIAGRRVMTAAHVENLCRVLDCKPEDLVEDGLKEDLTDTTGRALNGGSVKDIDMSHLESIKPQLEKIQSDPAFTGAHRPVVAPERLVRKAV